MSAEPHLTLRGRLRRGDLDVRVDLAVGAGITALIGANGTGKTSMLRLIAGLEALDDGELIVDGVVLARPADGTFVPPERRDIALAFQEPRLFPHMSVLDNIAYPLRRSRIGSDAARTRARTWAATVGLDAVTELRPGDLSGGQAQRANVARALCAETTTLLLDEPLASVDERARDELRQAFTGAGSRCVLWVSHDRTDLPHVDQVISLADVVQTGGR